MLEMVALRVGEEPDWEAARSYIDSLIIDEIDDELVENCGVDTESEASAAWLAKIKERLRTDLDCFRDDLLTDHDEIEHWELEEVRIFTSVGSWEDERDPNTGHGWMCRLVDSGALGAAGFRHVRKSEL